MSLTSYNSFQKTANDGTNSRVDSSGESSIFYPTLTFKANLTLNFQTIGLGLGGGTIEYAFLFHTNTLVYVSINGGAVINIGGAYNANDEFTISMGPSGVGFYRNGSLGYTASYTAGTYRPLFDVNKVNDVVSDIRPSFVAPGLTGATGVTGATGETGATGLGDTGATGATGDAGVTGDTGATGATGEGATGPTGDVGPTGAPGEATNTGATGPTGQAGGIIQLTQVLDNVSSGGGAVIGINTVPNWTTSYTSLGGTLIINTSFSAAKTGAEADYTFSVLIDGSVVGSVTCQLNGFDVFQTIPAIFTVENVAAGAHTITIRIPAGAYVQNCYANMTIQEIVGANSIGLTGPTGQGETGATGAAGETGATGPAGADGAASNTGATGPTGEAGATGEAGETGATGAAGAAGATGPAGTSGPLPTVSYKSNTGFVSFNNVFGSVYSVPFPNLEYSQGSLGLSYNTSTGIFTNNTSAPITVVVTATIAYSNFGNWTYLYKGTTLLYSIFPTDNGNIGLTQNVVLNAGDTLYIALTTSSMTLSSTWPSYLTVTQLDYVSGPTGQTGAAGTTGATGATGVGETGATGATGALGETGATGPTGEAGATGASGEASNTGATGPTGEAGIAGVTGDTGATGATGEAGATGPAGAAGFMPQAVYTNPTNSTIENRVVSSLTGGITSFPFGNLYTSGGQLGLTYEPTTGVVYNYTGSNVTLNLEVNVSFGIGAYHNLLHNSSVVRTYPYGNAAQLSHVYNMANGDIAFYQASGASSFIPSLSEMYITQLDNIQGPTGSTGTVGETGPTGDVGPTGAPGEASNTGATGPTGDIGLTGNTGATGPTGDVGATGPAGAAGFMPQAVYTFPLNSTIEARAVSSLSGIYSFPFYDTYNGAGQLGLTYDPTTGVVYNYTGSNVTMNLEVNVDYSFGSYNQYLYHNSSIVVTGAPNPNQDMSFSHIYNLANGDFAFYSIGNATAQATSASQLSITQLDNIQGPTGSTGTVGATGPTGEAGPTGAPGEASNTGATGATGDVGATGAQGDTGATGATGDVGATGPAGVVGFMPQTAYTFPFNSTIEGRLVSTTTLYAMPFGDIYTAAGQMGLSYDTTTGVVYNYTGSNVTMNMEINVASLNTSYNHYMYHNSSVVASFPTGSAAQFSHMYNLVPGDFAFYGFGSSNNVTSFGGAADRLMYLTQLDNLQGPTGSTGTVGSTGPTGEVGPTGAPGEASNTGATGPTGVVGETGPTGAPGEASNTGATGPTGTGGVTGPTGPAGGGGGGGYSMGSGSLGSSLETPGSFPLYNFDVSSGDIIEYAPSSNNIHIEKITLTGVTDGTVLFMRNSNASGGDVFLLIAQGGGGGSGATQSNIMIRGTTLNAYAVVGTETVMLIYFSSNWHLIGGN